MYHYLVKISYDGRFFQGVVPQKNAKTVLGTIFDELGIKPIRFSIVSRTDKGVSAKENCFVVSTKGSIDWREFKNEYIKIKKVFLLKEYINIRKFSRGKKYVYNLPIDLFEEKYIYKPKYIILNDHKILIDWKDKEFDIDLYKKAAKMFIGKHNFSNFAKGRVKNGYCTIYKFDIEYSGHFWKNIIEGDRFLYEMIRKMISFLVAVGKGRFPIDKIPLILNDAKLEPKPPSAPPEYLILEKIYIDVIGVYKYVKKVII